MNHDLEQWTVTKRAVASEAGVVAAQHVLAARAGAEMLAIGGNAVDAAVAAALALGVVEPWMCGLGGSGLAVVWRADRGEAHAFDFQGVLAAAASPEDYPPDPAGGETIMGFPVVEGRANVVGARAVTVPGAARGLATVLARHGRLGWDTVLGPAIRLADRGHPVDWFTTLQVALCAADLARDPGARAVWLPGGHPPQPETALPLGALPATLRRLAEEGPEALHGGEVGARLVADLAAAGSAITLEDLAAYRVLEGPAPGGSHRGVAIHTAGPASGGPRLLDFLGYIAARPGVTGPARWVLWADALDAAFAAHDARFGRAPAAGCTSSLSAVDAEGNMVALTYTLLNRFGAAWLSPSTGLLMNNAVAYFDPRPGRPTSIAGGKRINASNMCPMIATREGAALFALGASGANHIMPAVAQVAALMLEAGLDLEAAMNHPRIDASNRGSVRADPRLGPEVLAALAARGPVELAQRLVFPKLYACPSGVARDPGSGLCIGINDPSQPMGGAAAAGLMELPEPPPAAVPPRA